MPNVPGLIPTQDDPTTTPDKLGGRVPTDDRIPQAPQLRPVAAPVNTFARPPAFTDPGLQRLADSLGQLANGIYAFGDATAEPDKSKQLGIATQKLAGRTPEEQRQILAEDPALHGAVAERFAHGIIGSTSADQDANALRSAYATQFDRDNGNFDQFVNGYVRSVLDKEKDPTFARSYMERMQPTIDALRQEQTKYLAERTVTDQNNLIYGKFQATVNEALERGATPEAALGAIRQTMGAIDTVARRTPAEQEQILVQMLGRQVEGLKDAPDYDKKFAMLQGILNAKTVDPRTGQERSLLDDQTVGGIAHEVLTRATGIFAKRDEMDHSTAITSVSDLAHNADPAFEAARDKLIKEHPTWVTAEGIERMNGTFSAAKERKAAEYAKALAEQQEQSQKTSVLAAHAYPALIAGEGMSIAPQTYVDKDGGTKIYSIDDQLKDAAEILQRQIDQKFAGWKTDPEKASLKLATEVKIYGQNGLKNADWERQLKNGPAAATTVTAAGGDIPPALMQSYQLYRDLRAASPELLQKHLDERSQRFFEVARVAQETGMGADAKQALALAALAANSQKLDKTMPDQPMRETMDQAKRQLTGFMGFGGLADTVNADEVIRKVVTNATVLNTALGIPMDKAIEQAAPGVKASYAKVNGNAVFIGDRYVPKGFEYLASQYVDRYWEQNKEVLEKQDISKGDLMLFAVNGTPNWMIIPRGYPFAAGGTIGAGFSVGDLYRTAQSLRDRAEAVARQEQERRYDPWLVMGNPDDGGLVVGPLFKNGATEAQQRLVKDAAREKYKQQHRREEEILTQKWAPPPGKTEAMRPLGADVLPTKPAK